MRNQLAFLLFVPALLVAVPTSAQTPPLTMEQSTALRCSAAFALVAHGQANGNTDALKYPALGERGREYMVRSSARIMDDTGMTRDQVAAALSAEAQKLWDEELLAKVMPPCLALLDASGL